MLEEFLVYQLFRKTSLTKLYWGISPEIVTQIGEEYFVQKNLDQPYHVRGDIADMYSMNQV